MVPTGANAECVSTRDCADEAAAAAKSARDAVKGMEEQIQKLQQSQWTIECITTPNKPEDHRTATCPGDYVVAACSGGMNKSSMDIGTQGNSCHYQQPDIDWVVARCCRVKLVDPSSK